MGQECCSLSSRGPLRVCTGSRREEDRKRVFAAMFPHESQLPSPSTSSTSHSNSASSSIARRRLKPVHSPFRTASPFHRESLRRRSRFLLRYQHCCTVCMVPVLLDYNQFALSLESSSPRYRRYTTTGATISDAFLTHTHPFTLPRPRCMYASSSPLLVPVYSSLSRILSPGH